MNFFENMRKTTLMEEKPPQIELWEILYN